jgi:hypothetical protein
MGKWVNRVLFHLLIDPFASFRRRMKMGKWVNGALFHLLIDPFTHLLLFGGVVHVADATPRNDENGIRQRMKSAN